MIRSRHAFARLVFVSLGAACLASPALAQTSSVGGNIGAFIQQLIDLSTRERPSAERHGVKVLVVLDEFARLGRAEVIARAFSYVAGYGLRLLPVLQSPAQLRAEYGADLAQDILSNCAVEVTFGLKELRVAQELSERLGFYTYPGRARSRPTLLSGGHRSTTESDQRRALMLPQELTQMPPHQLLILRANMPPVKAVKITYWRERAFRRRLVAAPIPPVHPGVGRPSPRPEPGPAGPRAPAPADDLSLERLARRRELEPLPQQATPEAARTWVKRLLDTGTVPPERGPGREP